MAVTHAGQVSAASGKPGVTPQLLTSDNMILDLAKKGQLTITKTAAIVNATVVPKS